MSNSGKRLYIDNILSQQLVILFIAGNTVYTIFHVRAMDVTAPLGLFVMVNIALSLLAFLMAVQQKKYVLNWAYIGIAVAVFQFGRILTMASEITGSLRIFLLLLLISTGSILLVASIICLNRAKERQQYIDDNNIDLVALEG